MPDISRLTSVEETPDGELHTAKVNEDATEEGQAVTCTVEAFDRLIAFDPAHWTPYVNAAGVFFPKRGDSALLATPLDGPAVIVTWRPSATEPDETL